MPDLKGEERMADKRRSIEETLWDSANKLRGTVEPSEYKHVVLGLIFLKFASDKFEERRQELIAEGKEKYFDMVEFYTMKNVFYLPEISRWSYLKANAKQPDLALKIDTALSTVEKNNPVLKGALPDNYYSRLNLDVSKLASLLDTINNIDTLKDKQQDIVGRVYEYFLSKFALAEGKGKGEFYTPKSIVNLIAEMIEPYKGKIYDPCCGSGGMFVQSVKFIESHHGNKKMPIALLQEIDEAIISQAYPVFEIIDIEEILPEYLMMWFSRQEFDREACFYAIGGVRGSLEWEDFCDMMLPVPSIEKQKEIVKEYNVLVDRIQLNNSLTQKLEETAQAIYKQWFVDFEFLDENGKPYKSNGGEMEESELGEIPKEFEVVKIKDWGTVVTGKTPSSENPEHFGSEMPFVTPTDFKNYGKFVLGSERGISLKGINAHKNKIITKNSLIVTCIGSDMGKVVINKEKCLTNQQINSIETFHNYTIDYLYYYFKSVSTELKSIAIGGSTMPIINKTEFELINVLKPKDNLLQDFYKILVPINSYICNNEKITNLSTILKDVLLSKLATMEN